MGEPNASAWKCGVCGYVHRGDEPPEWCPVCGTPGDGFDPYADEAPPDARAAVKQWRCLNCSYVHTGPRPPDACPVCGASADRFEPLAETEQEQAASSTVDRVLVVGAGIAGLAAVESLRSAAPGAEITLISRESALPYYRLNLTRYLAEELTEGDLPIYPESWYGEQNVRLMLGTEVSSIDPAQQTVSLRNADKEAFDKLIVTIGAHPFVPPFPGVHRDGVTCFRTLDDAKQILESATPDTKCVCIGGGLLGLETAGALARRGVDVALLEGHGWLLPRQLTERAGALLERHVSDVGIKLYKRARTDEILGDERVRAVALEDGSSISADVVVIATGVRPNSYLARAAGLDVGQGIIVDNHLVSSHPNILAAGDVAEHRGVLYGIWVASRAQGNIAGMNAAGLGVEFGGIPRSNTLKVLGMDLFSIGKFEPEDGSFSVIEQDLENQYFRFVFRDSHLVGAILLGDASLTAPVKRAIESKTDFSALLRKRPGATDVRETLREGAS